MSINKSALGGNRNALGKTSELTLKATRSVCAEKSGFERELKDARKPHLNVIE